MISVQISDGSGAGAHRIVTHAMNLAQQHRGVRFTERNRAESPATTVNDVVRADT